MTTPDPSLSQFPMRVVVRRTGLSASLLRAWERRYAAVEPGRSDGGQRLYSEDDIRTLLLLKELVDRGHNIGQVAGRDPGELRLLLRQSGGGPSEASAARTAAGRLPAGEPEDDDQVATRVAGFLEDGVEAIRNLDARALEAQLNRAAMALNPATLVEGVLVPLLNRIGLMWAKGALGPAAEHVASGVIRRFLDWLLETLDSDPEAPVALVGTPAGHRHEFGALLASVVLVEEGWQVLRLGPDLPAAEIAEAASLRGAELVALSALYPREDPDLPEELRALRQRIGASVPILVGGPAAAMHADSLRDDGVEFLADLGLLRAEARGRLRELYRE